MYRWQRYLAVLLFAPVAALGQVSFEWPPAASLGAGYDLLTGEIKAPCVSIIERREPTGGISTEFQWSEVVDQLSLRERLGVSVSGAYWAAASRASAKLDLVRQTRIDQFSVYYIARQTNKYVRPRQITASLTKENQQLLQKDWNSFRAKCGTHFISGEVLGSELYATLSVKTSKEEEKQEIRAALSASAPTFQAGASTDSAIESSKYRDRLTVQGRKSGGEPKIFLDRAALKQEFLSFPQQSSKIENLVPIEAHVTSYSGALTIDARLNQLEAAAKVLLRYDDAEADLDYFETNLHRFYVDGDSARKSIPKVRSKLSKIRIDLQEQMIACGKAASVSDMKKVCDFSKFPSPPVNRSDFPSRYRGECGSTTLSIPPIETFSTLHRVNGDASMGGGDVIDFLVNVRSLNESTIVLDLRVTALETTYHPPTIFQKEQTGLVIWSSGNSGCYLKSQFGMTEDYPQTRTAMPAGIHSWTPRAVGGNIIQEASCRTNQDRGDDNYVGCDKIKLKPILVELGHIENRGGGVPPIYNEPRWLD